MQQIRRRNRSAQRNAPSVSAASSTPPSNLMPRTDVPVITGCCVWETGSDAQAGCDIVGAATRPTGVLDHDWPGSADGIAAWNMMSRATGVSAVEARHHASSPHESVGRIGVHQRGATTHRRCAIGGHRRAFEIWAERQPALASVSRSADRGRGAVRGSSAARATDSRRRRSSYQHWTATHESLINARRETRQRGRTRLSHGPRLTSEPMGQVPGVYSRIQGARRRDQREERPWAPIQASNRWASRTPAVRVRSRTAGDGGASLATTSSPPAS